MNDKNQSRWVSPVFWTALLSQLLSIAVYLNIIDFQVSDAIEACIYAVLELMVAFGILNNPTNGKWL